jgi:hypothetical protein
MWVAPFGGALTLYVASSAVLLGVRHPVRWLAGLAAAGVFLVVLAVNNFGPDNALEGALTRFVSSVVSGAYGFDFAMTGGEGSLSHDIDIPGRRPIDLWTALPSIGRWAAALLVWFAGALLALALAIRRHWER